MTIKSDKILIYIWPLLASFTSIILKTSFIESTVLFFGIPSVYISVQNSKLIGKIALFSFCGLILGIVIDYISVVSNVWYVPFPKLGIILLNVVSLDMMIWFFLYSFFIISYYEYFVENKLIDVTYKPNLKYLYILSISLFIVLLILISLDISSLNLPYFFLIFGIIFGIIPSIVIILKYRNLTNKFCKVSFYFFYFCLIYELTALALGQWIYPGTSYIGLVSIFGLSFPFEEFLFWLVLGSFSVLSYYELFDDDCN